MFFMLFVVSQSNDLLPKMACKSQGHLNMGSKRQYSLLGPLIHHHCWINTSTFVKTNCNFQNMLTLLFFFQKYIFIKIIPSAPKTLKKLKNNFLIKSLFFNLWKVQKINCFHTWTILNWFIFYFKLQFWKPILTGRQTPPTRLGFFEHW